MEVVRLKREQKRTAVRMQSLRNREKRLIKGGTNLEKHMEGGNKKTALRDG